jgi:hypothetical protein
LIIKKNTFNKYCNVIHPPPCKITKNGYRNIKAILKIIMQVVALNFQDFFIIRRSLYAGAVVEVLNVILELYLSLN